MSLQQLVEDARQAAAERAAASPAQLLQQMIAERRQAPVRDLRAALAQPGCGVIAEIKRRSPSRGEIAPGVDAVTIAAGYERAGAVAISVLTDGRNFGGSLEDLARVSAQAGVPVLRKDFLLDDYGLLEARAYGADAVLLMVRVLGDELPRMLRSCATLGMQALVEVHTAEEAERAVEAGASLIGVNNRDLDTLQIDPSTTERVRRVVPGDRLLVSESGIATRSRIQELADQKIAAVLVGTALMRSEDPASALAALTGVGEAAV